jgi:uncharacterized protein (DUF736 family)
MSKIGYLKPYNNGTYEELHGEVKTLSFQLKIKLALDNMRTNENAPDYIVYADTMTGEAIDIGAAWKKSKRKEDGSLLEFLSLTIDDLSLPQPLNVAAFKHNDGSYEISWRRRRPLQNDAA